MTTGGNIKKDKEPVIYDMATRFGTISENIVLNDQAEPDFADTTITQNTRCAYPLKYIEGRVESARGAHPSNIIMLTCDTLGVLPAVSKLTKEQAIYQFVSGYTSKTPGTERGIKEATVVFSGCFGHPFMPRRHTEYAKLLAKKLEENPNTNVWLVNTGWLSGGFKKGSRIALKHSRAIVRSIVSGDLENTDFQSADIIGLQIPTKCNGVPSEILNPINTWEDKESYKTTALDLIEKYNANFENYKDEPDYELIKKGNFKI